MILLDLKTRAMSDENRSNAIDWQLLARYFANELSAAERAEIEGRAAADPALRLELAALRQLWDQAGALPPPSRIDSMWESLAAQLYAADAGSDPTASSLAHRRQAEPAAGAPSLVVETTPSPKSGRRRAGAMAATFVITTASTLSWHANTTRRPEIAGGAAVHELSTMLGERTTLELGEGGHVIVTDAGERATATLVDGTRVMLGVESTLRVDAFTEGTREVYLEGEAIFDVIHDPDRPFLVRSAHAVTEDLGTEFLMRAYRGETHVRVVVASGSVTLRPNNAPEHSGTVLAPGQLGRLDATGKITVESDVDTEVHLSWTRGRILFRQATLREIAIRLERWYEVNILLPSPAVAGRRLTVDMSARPLPEVLDAITIPLDLNYELDGQTIVIREAKILPQCPDADRCSADHR